MTDARTCAVAVIEAPLNTELQNKELQFTFEKYTILRS
jgi:hypothetical protein